MSDEPTEMPDTRRRTRAEITADFDAGTATIREWVGRGAVHGPRLCEELAAWLDYWGGSPFVPALPEVPAGHELVVLPCDVVDAWAGDGVPGSGRAVILLDACRDTVARRPKPETEWVPWYRAMGRRLPDGELLGGIAQAHPAAGPGCKAFGGMYVEYELPESDTTANLHRRPSDGAVEVLSKDHP